LTTPNTRGTALRGTSAADSIDSASVSSRKNWNVFQNLNVS
jgi:hypothetical protein